MKELIILMLTLSVLTICAITDILYFKVYNIITFPAFILGIVINSIPFSADYLISTIIWVLVFYGIACFRIMGMGDIKLCMCILALQGIDATLNMMLFGIIFLITYCLFTNKQQAIKSLKETFLFFSIKKKIDTTNSPMYPFAFFLALGYTANFLLL